MPRSRHRFQTPPPADPIAAARDSSLAFRLNVGFFLRQMGVFLVMDLLLLGLAVLGLFAYAENRCADVALLVSQRGVPSEDALSWMEASDYTITPLDRAPEGYPDTSDWLPFCRQETWEGLRTWDLSRFYTIEMPNDGQPYAITVDLSGIFKGLYWAGIVILACQGLSLISGLFRSERSIRRVLRPIQDLAATAARLNSMTHMSKREIESLAGELDKIDAGHLDSRIDLPPTQKELRSLAKSINEMMDRVNQAYSAQMRFVSDASHELRTPIAVIQGYAALLDRWGKSDPDVLQESIDSILTETEHMSALIRKLLFLAKSDQNRLHAQKEKILLNDVASDIVREMAVLEPKREVVYQEEAGVTLWADYDLMKQLLWIHGENAIKYTHDGGRITVRVWKDKKYGYVSIADDGVGIGEEDRAKIFDRFYRVDKSRNKEISGTGLGLAIARWIVECHDGEILLESEQGKGTVFTDKFRLYDGDSYETARKA